VKTALMENVMGKKFLVAAVVATVVLGAGYYARSDLLAAADSQSRYVMKDTGNGFLRLDTKTGEMSMCQPKANSFVCEAVADDREALEKEIARLDDRIGVLKRREAIAKAQEVGYHPEIILAGRRMNDSMGHYVASEVIKLFVKNDIKIKNAKILVLGITFKENCPDVRNTKVVDVIQNLKDFGTEVTVFDPWANSEEVLDEYGLITTNQQPKTKFDGIVLAVAHNEFLNINFNEFLNTNGIIYDVKGVLDCKVHGKL